VTVDDHNLGSTSDGDDCRIGANWDTKDADVAADLSNSLK